MEVLNILTMYFKHALIIYLYFDLHKPLLCKSNGLVNRDKGGE